MWQFYSKLQPGSVGWQNSGTAESHVRHPCYARNVLHSGYFLVGYLQMHSAVLHIHRFSFSYNISNDREKLKSKSWFTFRWIAKPYRNLDWDIKVTWKNSDAHQQTASSSSSVVRLCRGGPPGYPPGGQSGRSWWGCGRQVNAALAGCFTPEWLRLTYPGAVMWMRTSSTQLA